MTKACEWGFIKENPLKNLKLLKIDRSPKVRYLSLEEETRLWQALSDREHQLKQERKSANQWRKDRGYELYHEPVDNKKSDVKVGLVFPSKNNQPFNNIKRSWSSLLKKANITQFRWHDLRHHFASKLVMAGIDLNTVRELLGHSDIKMTLRYAHLAPEHKINAVKKIDWSMQGLVSC